MSNFKVLSLNVWGINDENRRKLFLWLRKQNTDIVLLQETHITCESERNGTNELFLAMVQISLEVSQLFSRRILNTDSEGRFVELTIKMEDEVFKLLNLYAPNKINCQVNFFKRLKIMLTKEESQYNDNIVIKSLQCKWILRYLKKKESTWNSIINHYFKPLLCWCNYKTSLLSTKMPTFYEEVLTSVH